MAKKDRLAGLRKALDEQAADLEPAQGEFVRAQFEHYEWNAERIAQLERELERVGDERDFKAEAALFKQRHQLVAEQGQLFTHIMRWIKGTEAKEANPIDEFIGS